jgi:hypothetical protein
MLGVEEEQVNELIIVSRLQKAVVWNGERWSSSSTHLELVSCSTMMSRVKRRIYL